MNFRQAQAEGVAIGARQIRRGFFQLFDKRISAEVKQLFSGPIPKLLCIFFDKLGSRATQSVSKPSSDRAAQRSGHCGAESGCSHTNRWLRPGIGAERGHCRFTRRLALTGISVLAPNSLALYTRRGIPAHNYFLWPDLRLGTGSRLCQCEPPTAGRGLPMRFCQTRLRPLLTLDRFPGHGLIYPAGSDSPAIRRSILPNNRLVRWLSASKSQ